MPFAVFLAGIIVFSFFSVASAQNLLVRQAPQCSGMWECTSLYFKNLWQTLSSAPPAAEKVFATDDTAAQTTAGLGKPLIFQPNAMDMVGVGTLNPGAKLSVQSAEKEGTGTLKRKSIQPTGGTGMSLPRGTIEGDSTAFNTEVDIGDIIRVYSSGTGPGGYTPPMGSMGGGNAMIVEKKTDNEHIDVVGIGYMIDIPNGSKYYISKKNSFELGHTSQGKYIQDLAVGTTGNVGIGKEPKNSFQSGSLSIAGELETNRITSQEAGLITWDDQISGRRYTNRIGGGYLNINASSGMNQAGSDTSKYATGGGGVSIGAGNGGGVDYQQTGNGSWGGGIGISAGGGGSANGEGNRAGGGGSIMLSAGNAGNAGGGAEGYNGAMVDISGGSASSGSKTPQVGGPVNIRGGSGSTPEWDTANNVYKGGGGEGGGITITGGYGASVWGDVEKSGAGGSVVISGGNGKNTYGNIIFQPQGGSVGIGTLTPSAQAILDMSASDRGFLPPRTYEQATGLGAIHEGLTIYNMLEHTYKVWNGSAWNEMGGLWKKVAGGNDIFFTGGKVGIGTDKNLSTLTVKGLPMFSISSGSNQTIKATLTDVASLGGTTTILYGFSSGDWNQLAPGTRIIVKTPSGTTVDTVIAGMGQLTSLNRVTLTGNDINAIMIKGVIDNNFYAESGLSLDVYPNILRLASSEDYTKFLINSNGNVGIGTPSPDSKLTIRGGVSDANYNTVGLKLISSGPGWGSGIQFNNTTKNKTYGIYAAGWDDKWHFSDVTLEVDRMVIDSVGNVGIGTASPGAKLHLEGNGVDKANIRMKNTWLGTSAVTWELQAGIKDIHDNYFGIKAIPASGLSKQIITINPIGKVGINWTAPEYELDVAGDINVRNATGSSLGQNTNSFKIALAKERIGFDVAELFDTEENVEVGEILVIGSTERKLKKSSEPYQNTVIGVVSGAPAILFEGSQLKMGTSQKGSDSERRPAVALTGKVPVKVSLENGSIQVGDYLTTSSKSGVAMKATKPGMTIGVSLENYDGSDKADVLTFLSIKEANGLEMLKKLEDRIKELEKKLKKK